MVVLQSLKVERYRDSKIRWSHLNPGWNSLPVTQNIFARFFPATARRRFKSLFNFFTSLQQTQKALFAYIFLWLINHCLIWPWNWSFDGPIPEREAAEPSYFRLLPNLASGMISSLANYRPFLSPFRHIPRSGGFGQVSLQGRFGAVSRRVFESPVILVR